MTNIAHKAARLNRTWLLIGTVALLSLTLCTMIVLSPRETTPHQREEPIITYSTSKPDESKKNAEKYTWQGTNTEPKKIFIDKIGVNTYIQKAGIDQHRQVAVPNNVHLAGWFVDTVAPGKPGLSIIDGHVSGRTTDGVFMNIKKLQQGDTIKIEMGDGTVHTYAVITVLQVKADEASSQLFSQDPSVVSQLNLITCGGNFDRAKAQFNDRIIATAKLVAS